MLVWERLTFLFLFLYFSFFLFFLFLTFFSFIESFIQTSLLQFWARDYNARPNRWLGEILTNNQTNFSIRIVCPEEGNSVTYFEETAPNSHGTISEMALSTAHACVVIFSFSDRSSFLSVEERWIPTIVKQRGPNCPILLLGNKLDLRSRKVKRKMKDVTIVESNVPNWDPEKHSGYSIHDVPSEVLMRIFDYIETNHFPQLMLVCKRWAEVAKYPYLWKSRSKGSIRIEEINQLRRKFREIIYYAEISLSESETRKYFKTSKNFIRKVIEESAVSGRPPPTTKEEKLTWEEDEPSPPRHEREDEANKKKKKNNSNSSSVTPSQK
jgi:GTPase SAR1 family protein